MPPPPALLARGPWNPDQVAARWREDEFEPHAGAHEAAEASRDMFQARLNEKGYGEITTEIAPLDEFYYAEGYHQQYLAKNPNGYCGLGGTGVSCPIGVGVAASGT